MLETADCLCALAQSSNKCLFLSLDRARHAAPLLFLTSIIKYGCRKNHSWHILFESFVGLHCQNIIWM